MPIPTSNSGVNMARNLFGGGAAEYLTDIVNGTYKRPAKLNPVTFWSGPPTDLDRVQYTDLRSIDDPETVISSVMPLATGDLPEFFGPDDESVVALWASATEGASGKWISTYSPQRGAEPTWAALPDKPTAADIGAETPAGAQAKADAAASGKQDKASLNADVAALPAVAAKLDKSEATATLAPIKASLRGNRVVWIGDSITIAQGNENPASSPQESWGLSYPTYATYLSKGRIIRGHNSGVSGNRIADMLARFDTDVTPYAPSVVSIMAGSNDWNDAGPTPLPDYQRDIKAMVAKVRGIGAQPVLCTVPPNVLSAGRRQRTIIGNTWLRRYAAEQGIPLVDFYALLTDPATGDFLSQYGSAANDKTHPISAGYPAMAQFWWNTLSSFFPVVDQLLPMENADPNNKLTNGLFLTTTGTGASLMPTGWSVQGSAHPTGVTGALVTGDTTIKGNWWQIAGSGTATSTNNEYQTVSGIIPGHVYAHVGRFKATGMRGSDSGSGSSFLIGVAFNSTLNQAGYDFRTASTHYYDVNEGVFYHEMTAPANASTALVRRQLIANTTSPGTLQVAQMGFYDLTAMGLA